MPVRFTRVAEARFSPRFKERVRSVYLLFPELQDLQITCGYIGRAHYVLGTARSWRRHIALQPNISNVVIAHELTHLLQGANGVPHGEKACDIWAVARLPPEMLDERPYYILRHWSHEQWLVHRQAVRQLCMQAIEVRKTKRAYIKWLSGQFRTLKLKH